MLERRQQSSIRTKATISLWMGLVKGLHFFLMFSHPANVLLFKGSDIVDMRNCRCAYSAQLRLSAGRCVSTDITLFELVCYWQDWQVLSPLRSIQTSNNNDGKLLISSGIFGPKGLLSIADLQTTQDTPQLKIQVRLGDKSWEHIHAHDTEQDTPIFSSSYGTIGQNDQEEAGESLNNPSGRDVTARLQITVALPDVRRWQLGSQAQDTLYTVRLTLLGKQSPPEVSCEINDKF
jgi:hypothetical protein